MALNPGVNYTSGLIDYIIDYSKEKDIVKKQIANSDVDVISGKRFDSEEENALGLDFQDLVSVDRNMLSTAGRRELLLRYVYGIFGTYD